MIDMCTDTCDVCTEKINDCTDTCDNDCQTFLGQVG